ncbi:MAG: glycosyltransferase, partial [Flavobacteriales bacterium]
MKELNAITPHIHVVRLNPLFTLLQLFWAVLSSKPYQVHYFYQWNAARKIQRAIEHIKPDCIFAQLVRTAEYVKEFHHIPKALDYMDALSVGLQRRADASPYWMRWIIQEEQRRVEAYEHTIFEYFDRHFIISKQDQQRIRHPKNSSITILANGVDTTFFEPRAPQEPSVDLLFTGNMGYMPNIMAAERLVLRIVPLVRQVFPEVRVLIAGAEPSPRVQRLTSANVEVTGWVEDIRNAYQRARIFIAPMEIGSGMQNKLLEAMSIAVPVVADRRVVVKRPKLLATPVAFAKVSILPRLEINRIRWPGVAPANVTFTKVAPSAGAVSGKT